MSENRSIVWRLENDRIVPLLMHYAIPAVIGTMVNSLYNIVDRIFIGQGVGSLAISGLTLTFPILLLLQGFGMLIGAGAASRISILLGRKEEDKAEHVLGNALTMTLVLSVLTIVPSMYWMNDMLALFGGSDQTIPYAAEYLYIVIPGNLLASLSFGFNAIMRASGYPRKAMNLMLLGAGINIVLDPIFIFWFKMGIQGAAVATVISMLICSYFVLKHFMQEESLIRFRRKYLRPNWKIILAITTIGISPFSMQIAGSLINIVLNNMLYKHGGDLAVGANGIVSSMIMLLIMLNVGFSLGMQPIVGFNYGAGHHKRVFDTLRIVVVINTIINGIGCLCGWLIPEWIVRAFTNDPELIALSSNGLLISLAVFVVVGSQVSITNFFQSIGIAWKAMFLSLSRQFVFLLPALLILPPYFGLDGVWLAYPFSDFMAALTAWLFLYLHVKRLKK